MPTRNFFITVPKPPQMSLQIEFCLYQCLFSEVFPETAA